MAKGLDHEAVQGYTPDEQGALLPAVCKALGVDMYAHHHVAAEFNKQDVKTRMRKLRGARDAALEAHDSARLKQLRRELHTLNHRLCAHMA